MGAALSLCGLRDVTERALCIVLANGVAELSFCVVASLFVFQGNQLLQVGKDVATCLGCVQGMGREYVSRGRGVDGLLCGGDVAKRNFG